MPGAHRCLEACLRLGYLTGEQFDALFHPEEMV